MFFINFLLFFLIILLVESFVELVVKSELFSPVHDYINKLDYPIFVFISKAISCGYCFSFWASLFFLLLFYFTILTFPIEVYISNNYFYLPFFEFMLNLIINILCVQRCSNYLHGIKDRYMETYKDNRYI